MLLAGKTAIIYGGAGAIGSATARVFVREGAVVHLVGRTAARLEALAADLRAQGGSVRTAALDAMDAAAVTAHAEQVAAQDGRVDIALNAVGFDHVQGPGIADVTAEDFLFPITAYLRTNFVTAQAVSRIMVRQGGGVILTVSTPGARLAIPGILGNAAQSAALEGFSRALAGELGPDGVRVVCIRPHALSDAVDVSYTGEMFRRTAARSDGGLDDFVEGMAAGTLLGRLPVLVDVAEYAAFAASDRAASMTGAIANLTAGALVD